MNTKLSILDSIYDIEQTECASGLDTIGSMIEATDKAYSIIRECKTYGDDVYDMFSIFQEADENMDPDQHGKKISDMNKDEKRAYREKHAFKEDTPFMTFLKFLPNLVMLIVRSIGNLFRKKPNESGLKKAMNYIQNWSDEHQEEASSILSELYESITGKNPGSTIKILGIAVPITLIAGIFTGGFLTAKGVHVKVTNFFKKIFKKNDNDNVDFKFGLKLKIGKDKKVYWESDINLGGVDKYLKIVDEAYKILNKRLTPAINKDNMSPDELKSIIEEYNKKINELNSDEIKKGMFNEKPEEVKQSSEDFIASLKKIIETDMGVQMSSGEDGNPNLNPNGLVANLKNLSSNEAGSLKKAIESKEQKLAEDQFKDIQVGNLLENTKKDLIDPVEALCDALRAMIDHINEAIQPFSDGNFFEKILAKLRGEKGNEGIIGKLTAFIGGKRLQAAEHNEKHPNETTKEISEEEEPKNTYKTDDGSQYEEVPLPENATIDSLSKDGLVFLCKDNNEVTEPGNMDEADTSDYTKDGIVDISAMMDANHYVLCKKVEATEPPEENIEEESFVDSIDEDSSVYAEQVTNKWYSL